MRKVALALLIGLFSLSFFPVFIPAQAATNPIVSASVGGISEFAPSIAISLSTTATDSLVVFEYIATSLTSPCALISAPVDSNTNTWSQISNCLLDGNGAAMSAYSVTSNTQTKADTVTCNFANPNTQIEACYAFDISGAGAISMLATNFGLSTNPSTSSSTATGNALVLQTVGMEYLCQPVVGGFGFSQYIPASICNSAGMAGGFTEIGSGGATNTWPVLIGPSTIWEYMVVQIAPAAPTTTTTVYTATVTGFLAPDATHFSNSLILMIMPLAGMAFMLMPFMMVQRLREIGDKAIYPALFGFATGAALSDLSMSSQSVFQTPFAVILTAGLILFLWWWNS